MKNKANQTIIGYYTEDGKIFLEKDYQDHFGGAQGAAASHSQLEARISGKYLKVYQICEQDTIS